MLRKYTHADGRIYPTNIHPQPRSPALEIPIWHFKSLRPRVNLLGNVVCSESSAVDQDADVLDILVQSRRDKKAAKKFFRKLLKRLCYVPRALITDKLKSYRAAKTELMPSVEHLEQKYQNNRAENSHQPTRLREKVMRRFKSAGHAQRFLSAFGIITSHFRVVRHLYSASNYREVMKLRFAGWQEVTHSESAP